MKTLLLTLSLVAGIALTVKAQDESRNFIYYHNDSLQYSDHIRLRPDFYNKLTLRADSRNIPLNKVKFFNSDEGFFATTSSLYELDRGKTAERVIQGKINVFQERPYPTSAYASRAYREQEQVNVDMYYNKGYGDLQQVSYANLSRDMAGNTQSIMMLEQYHKKKKTSTILYVAAGASLVGSLVAFVGAAKPSLSRNTNPFDSNWDMKNEGGKFKLTIPLMLIGVGAAAGGFTTHASSYRKLEQAIGLYNE